MDKGKMEQGIRLLLEGMGVDLSRPVLQDTPARVVRMYAEVLAGMEQDPHEVLTVLEEGNHDEIVLLRNIPFYSICEHHLLPFLGEAHVAYLPNRGRITGLSKLARVVEVLSRRLQTQERLTTQIAEVIMKCLRPKGAMVIIEAEHLCMTMRGVKKPGSRTVTSVVRGIFRENPATRAEAMSLIFSARR